MLFRLIVLLMGGLFLAMYFAPEGDRPARPERTPMVTEAVTAPEPVAETETETAAAPESAAEAGTQAGTLPPVPEAPAQDVAPAPAPLVAPAETAQTPDAPAPEAAGEAADPFAATDPAAPPADPGTALPELGQLGASGNSDALDLSNSVRDRNQVEGVTPPPVRPGSPAAQPGAVPDPAEPATATAPARPPVGPVTGPRAQVTATSVNLRASPSTTASVVGRVNFGDTVVVTQQNAAPGWTGIRNPRTGEVAYVSSQFLKLVP